MNKVNLPNKSLRSPAVCRTLLPAGHPTCILQEPQELNLLILVLLQIEAPRGELCCLRSHSQGSEAHLTPSGIRLVFSPLGLS